ncbi:hypothetical protein Cgig2_016314 [Carnegiea gigantea]|uniref:Reverse transcriptase n=1 Tax=Carnegiea gigantea TaxID=171969 RepID=A0A9Q1KHB3_9CARY|nr:hypothetical protein Cgig2_016314 [Carnegiea gigantea]
MELFQFHKSKLEYIKDGDRNTRFYHLSTIVRRRLNRIEGLQRADGTWGTNSEELKPLVDLGNHLGVPTLSKRVTKATFQQAVDRVDKRLTGWATKCLSLVVRITPIKSTLMTITAYTMQMCRILRTVCDELDRKIRRFLWAGTNMEQNAWASVTKSPARGVLGIRPMRELNSVSMAKIGWRMLQELNALWLKVLKHRYYKTGVDMFTKCRNPSNMWKGVSKSSVILQKGIIFSVGDGQCTLF